MAVKAEKDEDQLPDDGDDASPEAQIEGFLEKKLETHFATMDW